MDRYSLPTKPGGNAYVENVCWGLEDNAFIVFRFYISQSLDFIISTYQQQCIMMGIFLIHSFDTHWFRN